MNKSAALFMSLSLLAAYPTIHAAAQTSLGKPSPSPASDVQAQLTAALVRRDARFVIPPGIHRINSALRLHKVNGFTLEGASAQDPSATTLVFTNLRDGGISISDCTQLALIGFTIDFDPLPFTQGTIDTIDAVSGTLTYTVHEGYPDITPDRLSTRAHVFDPTTLDWKISAPDVYATSSRILSPRQALLSFSPERRWQLALLAPGDLIVQDIRHHRGAIRVESGRDITFSHLTILSAPGLAMTLRFMDGKNDFKHINILPGPPPIGAKYPRLISASADGFNYAYARTGPNLENCNFSRMGDDSVNLHGIAFVVASASPGHSAGTSLEPSSSPSITLIRPYGREAFLSIIQPGDEIHALSQGNFDITGGTTLIGSELPRTSESPEDIELANQLFPIHRPIRKATFYTLRLASPLQVQPGDLVEIPAIAAPEYTIRHNHFKQHRGRALRLMSAHGIVEDNTMESIKQAPITLGHEFVGFREAGWVQDIIVRRNTIKNSAFDPILQRNAAYAPGAISVIYRGETPDAPRPANARNRNICIEQNIIENVGGPAIHINQADQVVINDNHISRANQIPPVKNPYGLSTSLPIEVNHSTQVTITP